MRPHTRQPTRLPRPWDSPGTNTGVGCHFLLQCMKVKSEREVVQSCLTLHDPMGCSLPGSSIEESKRQVHSNIKLFSFQFWEIVNSCYNWPFSCSHSLPVLHTVLTNASLRKYYGKFSVKQDNSKHFFANIKLKEDTWISISLAARIPCYAYWFGFGGRGQGAWS